MLVFQLIWRALEVRGTRRAGKGGMSGRKGFKKEIVSTFWSKAGAKTRKKRILFLQNEARKLLKSKRGCGKNSQNEPKTKLKRS